MRPARWGLGNWGGRNRDRRRAPRLTAVYAWESLLTPEYKASKCCPVPPREDCHCSRHRHIIRRRTRQAQRHQGRLQDVSWGRRAGEKRSCYLGKVAVPLKTLPVPADQSTHPSPGRMPGRGTGRGGGTKNWGRGAPSECVELKIAKLRARGTRGERSLLYSRGNKKKPRRIRADDGWHHLKKMKGRKLRERRKYFPLCMEKKPDYVATTRPRAHRASSIGKGASAKTAYRRAMINGREKKKKRRQQGSRSLRHNGPAHFSLPEVRRACR